MTKPGQITNEAQNRVVVYIDGFNLYHGLRSAGWRWAYWLDLTKLSTNLLKPGQIIHKVKYFTARIAGALPSDSEKKSKRIESKRQRQNTYLDALSTLPNLQIYQGHYLAKTQNCHTCGAQWTSHEEKMTDVSIATEMLVDAYQNRFDTGLLISADSDLTPPTHAIRKYFPGKRIVAAFPPKRSSVQLKQACDANFTIGRGRLKQSMLPENITLANGHQLRRPVSWS